MRKVFTILCVILILFSFTLLAQSTKMGPYVDKLLIDVRMQQDIGLKDAAEGKTDIFYYGVEGPTYKGLPEEVKAKLEVYKAPAGFWSFSINPYPNAAPYTFTKDNKVMFNPFAIREIRFALNHLLNRKYVVDEILGGDGDPMYVPMVKGNPGTSKYMILAAKSGLTAAGNEKKAISDITAAFEAASQLPENKGKLVKKGDFWQYDGVPVTVKFLIRVDDPTGRLKLGRYFADLMEKTGMKVERLEYDRRKCFSVVYDSNPANMEWNIYTEGWGSNATQQWHEGAIAQYYAPWQGFMAGGGSPDNWNYENKEIDALTIKIVNGQFINADEYWTSAFKALDMGLKDSQRIMVASQMQYMCANKDRFLSRMIYGLGNNMDRWSLSTANVKPDKNGQKVLKYTLFSARGSLSMGSWDPVGIDGLTDIYSSAIFHPQCDNGSFLNHVTAVDMPWRTIWNDVQTKITKGSDGKIIGQIPVPSTAVMFNGETQKWEPVASGTTSFSSVKYSFKFGKFHDGRVITLADVLYAIAFSRDWSKKDGENDKNYDESYAGAIAPFLDTVRGLVIDDKNNTITIYGDYAWPMEKNRVGSFFAFWTTVPTNYNVGVSWPIYEAMAKMVTEGAASKTTYSFTYSDTTVEPDVGNQTSVADIRDKLVQMKNEKYIPSYISKRYTAENAVKAYDLAIKFIDSYKHAFISTGPFYMHSWDPKTSQFELRAFRDSYPYTAEYWVKKLSTQRARIDNIKVPQTVSKNSDTTISVSLSALDFPADIARPASKGNVKLILLVGNKELSYTGKFVKNGLFNVVIPAKDISNLSPGSYLIIVETTVANESPVIDTSSLTIF